MLYMCVVSMITYTKDPEKGKKHGSFSISFKEASVTSLRQVDSAETKEPCRSTNYVQYTHEVKFFEQFTRKLRRRNKSFFLYASSEMAWVTRWLFPWLQQQVGHNLRILDRALLLRRHATPCGKVISDVIYIARGPNLGTQLCVTISCQLSSSVAFDVHTVEDVVVCQECLNYF